MTDKGTKSWILRWKTLGPVLDAIRLSELKDVNTAEAICSFNGLFEQAIKAMPPQPISGLIEQQKWFKIFRDSCNLSLK